MVLRGILILVLLVLSGRAQAAASSPAPAKAEAKAPAKEPTKEEKEAQRRYDAALDKEVASAVKADVKTMDAAIKAKAEAIALEAAIKRAKWIHPPEVAWVGLAGYLGYRAETRLTCSASCTPAAILDGVVPAPTLDGDRKPRGYLDFGAELQFSPLAVQFYGQLGGVWMGQSFFENGTGPEWAMRWAVGGRWYFLSFVGVDLGYSQTVTGFDAVDVSSAIIRRNALRHGIVIAAPIRIRGLNVAPMVDIGWGGAVYNVRPGEGATPAPTAIQETSNFSATVGLRMTSMPIIGL